MSQVINLSVDVLKVHPQNTEFFDDIEGEQYTRFKKSIEEDGIITPIIVTPDMTIISGHQRYKASKDLGIKLVPSIIREDLEDEDEQLKKLLATNFGRMKNNPVKQGRVYEEYERLMGVRQGSAGNSEGQIEPRTREDIARELGVSVSEIKRLKKLNQLSPELQQLIESGEVKYTTALNVWGKLSNEDQAEFIEKIGRERISSLTAKETVEAIRESENTIKQLSQKIGIKDEVIKQERLERERVQEEYEKLKNSPVHIKEVPIETIPMDYEHIKESNAKLEEKIVHLRRLVEDGDIQIEHATKEKELLERKAKLNEKDSEKYKQLKSEIENLSKEKNDLGRQIKSRTELSGLVVRIEHMLKTELAPIKYSRAIDEASTDEIVTRNLRDIVVRVEGWCEDMYQYIPKSQANENIIDVEVVEYE